MNLVVDIGNSLMKAAVFDAGRMCRRVAAERLSTAHFDELLRVCPGVRRAIVASTGGSTLRVAELLRERGLEVLEFSPDTPVPIRSAYATPRTLGADRLAAAVAAAMLYPGREVLIVDLGTALTIDRVSADGTFRGGVISPGLWMRFKALHDLTARLPMCGETFEQRLLGDSTQSAIEQGVMNGIAFEVEGYMARLKAENREMCTIFTGGDAKYFVNRVKNAIFADCELVLCGLDRILTYNAEG